MKIIDSLLRLLFPPKCLVCAELIGHYSEYPYCVKCYNELTEAKICGPMVSKSLEHADKSYVLYNYKNGSVKYSVFHAKKCFSKLFANLYRSSCQELFEKEDFIGKIDLITFATRRSSERRREGLDQACEMAKVISQFTKIPYAKTLTRKRASKMQRTLSHEQRALNVKNLFKCINNDVKGKNILITDDVVTTGSTVSDCARALKAAGAKSVTILVFAS